MFLILYVIFCTAYDCVSREKERGGDRQSEKHTHIFTDTHTYGCTDVLKYLQFYSNQKKNWVKKTHCYARTVLSNFPYVKKKSKLFSTHFSPLFGCFCTVHRFSVLNFNYTIPIEIRFDKIFFLFLLLFNVQLGSNNLSWQMSKKNIIEHNRPIHIP